MLLQSKNFITRTSLGWRKLKQNSFGGAAGFSCSTKQIVAAYKTRLIALGVTVGSTKCLATYINRLVENTQEYCDYVARRLYLESIYLPIDSTCSTVQIANAFKDRLVAAGVVIPTNVTCTAKYINRFTGSGEAECATTSYILRLQALGVVTGPTTCLTNYITNLTGE